MSAQDELPPGCERSEVPGGSGLIAMVTWPAMGRVWGSGKGGWEDRVDASWTLFTRITGITREEFGTMRAAVGRDTEFPMSQMEVIEEALVSFLSDCTEADTEEPPNWAYWAQMMVGVDRSAELFAEHFRGEEVEAEQEVCAIARADKAEADLAEMTANHELVTASLLNKENALANVNDALRVERTAHIDTSLQAARDIMKAAGKVE